MSCLSGEKSGFRFCSVCCQWLDFGLMQLFPSLTSNVLLNEVGLTLQCLIGRNTKHQKVLSEKSALNLEKGKEYAECNLWAMRGRKLLFFPLLNNKS